MVKTRFAPSPTGALHVGNVRTALFAYLFARHNKGEFILRIEDTDQERSTAAASQGILDDLAWLGLEYDAGPIYQTSRYERYNDVLKILLDKNLAYRCNCSMERLEKLRESQLASKEKPKYDGHCRNLNIQDQGQAFVIRFLHPDVGSVSFNDAVYGDISVDNAELDDFILLRSDGNPTYNFAVVVDDCDMGITHVIRGDDHVNNTPKQILLFEALNFTMPRFVHLTTILGEDGKKLSKRHGAVTVSNFRELGFLPQALLNYLVRLGWSCGDEEIFTMQEMIEKFDLAHLHRGVSTFNYNKLLWTNEVHQKNDDPNTLIPELVWHFARYDVDINAGPNLLDLIAVQKGRAKTIKDLCEQSLYFYQENIHYDPNILQMHTSENIQALAALHSEISNITNWQPQELHLCLNKVLENFSLKLGKFAPSIRYLMTGGSSSPSIDLTLWLLGREKVLQRLNIT
jgi:glutamyl-tRNA synthetase